MTAPEDRVIGMDFDNSKFENKVRTTLRTLQTLKTGLDQLTAKKGVGDIGAELGKTNLNPLRTQIDGVSKGFLAMSTVAVTALATITTKAVTAGANFAKSFTLQPITAGFQEYGKNLQSIQTILANTQASGAKLKDVEDALKTLNEYSDKTIYNFSEMADNIGTFTAAGVDLKTSTEAIKGIANLAALSGSNSQQASTAMYQLSQAISAGKVGLQDWNSVVNAGMGGTVFQRALANTAVKMGELKDGAVSLEGPMKNVSINGESFRQSLDASKGPQWLTSKVLTQTLKQFTGDLSDAELAAQGFSDKEIFAIQQTAKTAQMAATEVKTLSGVIDVARETSGSGWAQTFQIIFGGFNEAKTSMTQLSNFVNGFINRQADARNAVLEDWKKLGGRDMAIEALKSGFQALSSVLKPIKDAFRDIFPAKTGQDLYNMTVALKNFFDGLKLSDGAADNLRRTFAGVFALFSIGWEIIKRVVGLFFDLGSSAAGGEGGILSITASLGDFLVSIDKALKEGGALNAFFNGLEGVLSIPMALLEGLGSLLSGLFGSLDVDVLGDIAGGFEAVGDAIANAFNADNVNAILSGVGAGLLGGILFILKRFIGRITTLFSGGIFGGGGFLDSMKDSFQSLTGALQSMQTLLQAKTLQAIAIAVALLAASMVALSLVNPKRLGQALAAMTVAFGELLLAMSVVVKLAGHGGFIKLPFIAGSMVLLAGAVLVLSAAVKVLSTMSWGELIRGLTGVGVLLGSISLFANTMGGSALKIAAIGAAMIPLAAGILLLSGAVKILAGMTWTEIAKGMTALAGSLTVVALAMRAMPLGLPVTAAGLVGVGIALNLIAHAMGSFGGMSLMEIGKGVLAIAGSLVVIGAAMRAMPLTLPITAAGLVLVSIALQGISRALGKMGSMSWEDIAKGLVAMGGALAILAVGTQAMSGALLGAIALTVVSGALLLLVPTLLALGSMSWESIGKGLVTLAGALTIMGVAGLLMAPVVPALIGLGAAIALFGAGIALAGGGLLAFVAGLTALIAIGGAAAVAVGNFLKPIIALVPEMVSAVAKGVVNFVQTIGAGAPAMLGAMVNVLTTIIQAVINALPKIREAVTKFVRMILSVLVDNVGRIASAGIKIIISLIQAMSNNVGKVVSTVTKLIINFIRALSDNAPKLADAGAKSIVKFVNALSKAIDANAPALGKAAGRLGVAIGKGIITGIGSMAGEVANAAKNMAGNAIKSIGNKLKINSPSKVTMSQGRSMGEGMTMGIDAMGSATSKAGERMANQAVNGVKKGLDGINNLSTSDINLVPTIRPVVDLSDVKKKSGEINNIFTDHPLATDVSYSAAVAISDSQTKNSEDDGDDPENPGGGTTNYFEQNNYSPKAISPVEHYRNTKNLLALAKEE